MKHAEVRTCRWGSSMGDMLAAKVQRPDLRLPYCFANGHYCQSADVTFLHEQDQTMTYLIQGET